MAIPQQSKFINEFAPHEESSDRGFVAATCKRLGL